MPDTPIPWTELKPGNRYRIAFSDDPNQIGTLRYVKKGPGGAVVLFDKQAPWIGPKATEPIFFRMPADETRIKFYPTFGEKLALLNTKLGADPGVLSEIMKFNTSNFKPGPWTEMTKAQAAVSAAKAKAGTRRKTRRRRSTRRRA
jgi:hypothetical protein